MKSCSSSANVVGRGLGVEEGHPRVGERLGDRRPPGEEVVEVAVVGLEAVDGRSGRRHLRPQAREEEGVLHVVVLVELQREALGPASERLPAIDSLALGEGRDRVAVTAERIALGLVDGEVEAEVGLVVHGHAASDVAVGRRLELDRLRSSAASRAGGGPSGSTAPHPSSRRSPTPAPHEDVRRLGRRARACAAATARPTGPSVNPPSPTKANRSATSSRSGRWRRMKRTSPTRAAAWTAAVVSVSFSQSSGSGPSKPASATRGVVEAPTLAEHPRLEPADRLGVGRFEERSERAEGRIGVAALGLDDGEDAGRAGVSGVAPHEVEGGPQGCRVAPARSRSPSRSARPASANCRCAQPVGVRTGWASTRAACTQRRASSPSPSSSADDTRAR